MNKSNNFVWVELLEKSEFQRHINEVKSLEKNILKITRLRTGHCKVALHDQVYLVVVWLEDRNALGKKGDALENVADRRIKRQR